ncbi:pyridoxamine 5'-phosphate oxidase family protein [Mesorhizobium sp. PAMC28654]|uniref:pyridoxamine 5'-phosphate oxidase family protein n=1 Tax=Mesorhizobium sp. PAMC28654 TaxID=2880934 RepID=UPI001D0ADE21|nr:pyridoxamine 5'-phosphate oxidase family protein [Mesorhizobium sp. PAMC28654]UDL90732.1 pyridoxamine 5'-phosphate oxidase family protein [Mesorhizobium sp. PAMC28654]
MKHELQKKMINILARCMDMTIATTRSDGSPQATVVSFVHDGLLLYFGCGAGSQKAVNISRDPRVSVAMTAPYENWLEIKGLSMAATATEVVVPSELTEVGRLMVQRFPQIPAIQPGEATPVKLFKVRPTIISVLDYTLGFGHTDLVKVEAGDIAETLDSMRHHWLVGASATS